MVSMETIVEYVINTPENINKAILRQLINEYVAGQAPITPSPSMAEDIQANTIYFGSNVYNKKGSNQRLNRENDSDVAEHFYVKVIDELPNGAVIKIDGKVIGPEDTFALSVGNNSFVDDVCYYIEDSALYIAFPLLSLEEVIINSTVIASPNNLNDLVITGTKIVGEGEMIPRGDGNYIANITKRNSYIDFGLQGVQVNEIILSKKIYNGNLTYGFIKADEKVDNIPGIGYYPFAWCTTEERWQEIADIATTKYTLFSGALNAIVTTEIEARKNGAIEDETVIYDGGDVEGN